MATRRVLVYIIISFLLCPYAELSALASPLSYQGTHILTYKTMYELSDAYYRKTGIRVQVRGGGCADGISAVLHGRALMGGLCCPLPERTLQRMGLVAYRVASDIKVVVVNPENPIQSITLDELRKIHQGKIKSWSALGWLSRPVALIFRKHCLDMKEPLRGLLGINDDLSNLNKRTITVRTDKQVVDYVSTFKTAIGVTSKVFTEGKRVKLLRVNNVEPNAENVRKGLYPLYSPLFIIVKKERKGDALGFINFMLSKEGRAIINKHLSEAGF